MRRVLAILLIALAAVLLTSASASAASLKSCADINHKINGKNYKLATKVKVKGITCADAKAVVVAYSTGAGMLSKAALESLKNRCKADKSQGSATKAGRTATTCASPDGKRVLKGWFMNG